MAEMEIATGASQADISARASDIGKMDQIIDNSYDSIIVTDKHGKVLLANPAALWLLQVKSEELCFCVSVSDTE